MNASNFSDEESKAEKNVKEYLKIHSESDEDSTHPLAKCPFDAVDLENILKELAQSRMIAKAYRQANSDLVRYKETEIGALRTVLKIYES